MRSFWLGPFSCQRSRLSVVAAIFLVVFLTALTEIGGVLLWFSYGIGGAIEQQRGKLNGTITFGAFVVLYALFSSFIVPMAAPFFGRVALNCFASVNHPYEANSPIYCILNRHYVQPEAREVVEDLSVHMNQKHPGTVVSYLDANFPFLNGIPLLPHQSHSDGKKLDIAFFYIHAESHEGQPKGGAWPIGYWAFAPTWKQVNETPLNFEGGIFRWNMKWLQNLFSGLELDRDRTAEVVKFLTATKTVQRVFLEPYLMDALNTRNEKIGFAGFNAARHDDHIHFQIF